MINIDPQTAPLIVISWLVSKFEGKEPDLENFRLSQLHEHYDYGLNLNLAVDIMQRERIDTWFERFDDEDSALMIFGASKFGNYESSGHSIIEAGMRCYVSQRIGEFSGIELPEDLFNLASIELPQSGAKILDHDNTKFDGKEEPVAQGNRAIKIEYLEKYRAELTDKAARLVEGGLKTSKHEETVDLIGMICELIISFDSVGFVTAKVYYMDLIGSWGYYKDDSTFIELDSSKLNLQPQFDEKKGLWFFPAIGLYFDSAADAIADFKERN